MKTRRQKRLSAPVDKTGDLLEVLVPNVQMRNPILEAIRKKGLVAVTVAATSVTRSKVEHSKVTPDIKNKRKRRKEVIKYISTHRSKRTMPKLVRDAKTYKKEVRVYEIDLDLISDADVQLFFYDLLISKSESLDVYTLKNSHIYTLMKIVSKLSKKGVPVKRVTCSELDAFLRYTVSERSVVEKPVPHVDLKDVDDVRLELGVRAEVQRAIADKGHPMHNIIEKMLRNITEVDDMLDLLNKEENVKVKNKLKAEVL